MAIVSCCLSAVSIVFTIAAGKYDGDDINWKYLDEASDCAEALKKFDSVRDYPVAELHVRTRWDDGSQTRVDVFGGFKEKLIDGRWVQVDALGLTADERATYVKQSRTL